MRGRFFRSGELSECITYALSALIHSLSEGRDASVWMARWLNRADELGLSSVTPKRVIHRCTCRSRFLHTVHAPVGHEADSGLGQVAAGWGLGSKRTQRLRLNAVAFILA
jgi:hypothetical protein